MKDTKACDCIAGLGFVAIGAAVIWLAGQLEPVRRGVGPAGYPTIIAILMIALGAVLVGRSLHGGLPKFSFGVESGPAMKVAALVALSFAYTYMVKYLGFLILTPVLLFILMYLFEYRKYRTAIITSICVSTCTWIVFSKIFMIFLPEFSLF